MNHRAGKMAGFFHGGFVFGFVCFFHFLCPIKTTFGIAIDFSYHFPLIDFYRELTD